MKEYIEREAFVDAMHGDYRDIELVKNFPSADVEEVRHAYWRDIQPPDQDNNVQSWCSACGAGALHAGGMIVPYCWKCGAKMDGGVNDAAD